MYSSIGLNNSFPTGKAERWIETQPEDSIVELTPDGFVFRGTSDQVRYGAATVDVLGKIIAGSKNSESNHIHMPISAPHDEMYPFLQYRCQNGKVLG